MIIIGLLGAVIVLAAAGGSVTILLFGPVLFTAFLAAEVYLGFPPPVGNWYTFKGRVARVNVGIILCVLFAFAMDIGVIGPQAMGLNVNHLTGFYAFLDSLPIFGGDWAMPHSMSLSGFSQPQGQFFLWAAVFATTEVVIIAALMVWHLVALPISTLYQRLLCWLCRSPYGGPFGSMTMGNFGVWTLGGVGVQGFGHLVFPLRVRRFFGRLTARPAPQEDVGKLVSFESLPLGLDEGDPSDLVWTWTKEAWEERHPKRSYSRRGYSSGYRNLYRRRRRY